MDRVHMCRIGASGRKERRGAEVLCENKMAENFPELLKSIFCQIQGHRENQADKYEGNPQLENSQ